MKPVIAVLWIVSIALAVGLTRLAGPDRAGSEAVPSLDEAFGEFDPLRRAYLMSWAFQDFGPDDLPELHQVLVDRRIGIVPEEVRLFMLAWSRFDGRAAYTWASEGPTGWRKTLMQQAAYAWGYYDGPAALAAVMEIEDPKLQTEIRQRALEGWMRSEDKLGFVDYLANLEDGRVRGRFLFLLGAEVAMREWVEGAMRWVEALPDDAPYKMKASVFKTVAKIVAEKDPDLAKQWYLAHRTRPYSDEALQGIARRWVQHHDRPSAFEWLLSLSAEELHEGELDDAIAAGFRSWMQMDPEPAQEWLRSMLPNPALDPAIVEAVKRLLPADPGASMAWALQLDDAKKRKQESIRVGIRWREKEPEVFAAWLAEHDLPEGVRKKILEAPLARQPQLRRRPQPGPPPQPENPSES